MFITFTLDEPLTQAESEAAYELAKTSKVQLSHVTDPNRPNRHYRVEGTLFRVRRFYRELEKI